MAFRFKHAAGYVLAFLLGSLLSVMIAAQANRLVESVSPSQVKKGMEIRPNAVDIGFAQSMIQHHNQAVYMASMLRQSPTAEIRQLAQNIELSQTHEMGQMRGWLSAWDAAPLPPANPMAWVEAVESPKTVDDQLYAAQCKAAGGQMAGMATPEQLAALKKAQGREKDQLFLELMLAHHQAAIPMARFAMNNGQSYLIRNFAYAVIKEQTAEIAWIKQYDGANSISANTLN